MPRFCLACALALAALYLLSFVQPQRAHAVEPVSFIRQVAPLLQEQCFACHNARKKSGKYDMTRFKSLEAGGPSGETFFAGEPGESELHRLMVTDDDRRMPPRDRGDAVPATQAALVARWIAEGAKLDAGIDPDADLVREIRERWQPPAPPERYAAIAVNALAFTPDGKSLVVGGRHEFTVRSLDGTISKRVRTRMPRIYALAFLANGTVAAAGGRPGVEGEVSVYDLSRPGVQLDGTTAPVRVARLVSTDDSVLALAVSPDGQKLAAGGCDRLARVWDVSGGAAKAKLIATIDSHTDWVSGVAFSPDGEKLATASRDKTAKIFDLAIQESVATFPGHNQSVAAVAFTPDGKRCASVGADRKLHFWPISGDPKQAQALRGHGGDISHLVAGPSGLLVTASVDKTVRTWDAKARTPGVTFAGLSDYATAAAISPDGKQVAGGSFAGEVRVWDAASGKVVAAFSAAVR